MLELPIQGKATFLPVVTEQRGYGVHLTECGTGRYLVTRGGEMGGDKILGGTGLGEVQPTTSKQYCLSHCPFGHK
jgi:hypothetical protein